MKNVEERREIKIKAPQFLLRGRFTRKMRIVLTVQLFFFQVLQSVC
jgi:hypothetical protein